MCGHPVKSGLHCSACHRDFTSLSAFDRHQTLRQGKIICADPMVAEDAQGRQIFTINAGTGKFSLAPHGANPWGETS